MATIKPTLSIVSNNSSHATPGPLSMALDLSTTVDVTCDDVHQGVVTIDDATSHAILFSGATQSWRSGTFTGAGDAAPGYGGYVYLKNVSALASDIYIGIGDDSDAAADLAGADQVDAFENNIRWCTLKQNEFAFFPWDYTTRITYDASGAATLEWWIFDR